MRKPRLNIVIWGSTNPRLPNETYQVLLTSSKNLYHDAHIIKLGTSLCDEASQEVLNEIAMLRAAIRSAGKES